MSTARRTQSERRDATRAAVLDAATTLFGERGYAATSIDDIAVASGATIRPIYHYFGSKLALFAAVNDRMEQRIVDAFDRCPPIGDAPLAPWRAFLDLCADPGFRQVVLVDAPAILGRERWADSPVTRRVRELFAADGVNTGGYRAELIQAIYFGAFTQAALVIAGADDPDAARVEADRLVSRLFEQASRGR